MIQSGNFYLTIYRGIRQQGLQPPSSEQADTKTQPDATATALGRLGMQTAESGNSKRMSASQDVTAKSASWSLRFLPTQTLKPCRNLSASFATQERKVMPQGAAEFTFTSERTGIPHRP
uniref:Uncharacterized protein n=1 Tax=Siphoviridae sp. ctquf9 TaxID=2826470 RepID=A0A8S5M461_9CAUD|nr:MAG TPA: hypothetical protein [Siphoviridae sp. ctquf9]